MSFNVIYPNTLDLRPGAEANDEFLVYSPVLNKIVRIKIATLLSGKSVPVWDPEEPYTIDFIVEWNLKFWKSLQNANEGNIPNENAFWTEVSPETVVATEVDSMRKTLSKTAHGFVAKDVITIDNTGAYVKVSNTSTQKPIGIVRTVIDANTFELVLAGYIDNLSGLTPGALYHVNNSGTIVATVSPLPVLLAVSATAGFILSSAGGSNIPTDGFAVASGTNIYTATVTPTPAAYVAGLRVTIQFTNASTITNPTLNLNGLGARTIVKRTNTALVSGDIAAGQIYNLVFDGTNFRLLGIANSAILNDLAITNQIESGKNVGVYIRSSDGQLTKLPWLEYDVTNRKVLITGNNNLSTGNPFEILNSDLARIVAFFNDLRMEMGGTQFIIEPNNLVPSGNARFRLNDNQAMGLILEDKSGKEYVSWRTTDNDERFNVRVPQRLDVQGNNVIPYDTTQPAQVTANAANGSTTLITTIPMNTDEEYVVVKCRWSCVNNAGVGGRGIVEGSVIRISGGTVQDFGSQTVLDIKRTAGDFVMNIVADNVNKRININFVNNSTGGLAFRVTIHELSFVRLLEPA
ncbi:MAG: hypothetical protein ACK5OS_02640 [Chryseotalea sp.]